MRRRLPLLVAVAALAAGAAHAAEGEYQLPDIGSSAATVLSPAEEREYGGMLLRELRRAGMVLDDPLLDGYLQGLGYRLVATSERPTQGFTFFLLDEREINAFATLGGYVGVNAGLFLHAESEDEVAAVLAHEVAHVTQRHVLRAVERAQRDALPTALAMLGAMLAARSAGGDGDATQAILAAGMGLSQQRQINYTRSNEQEADRVGIASLSRAGYAPQAMATFFERMQRASRTAGSGASQFPDYLRTHPVTTTRISEARDRARGLVAAAPLGGTVASQPLNPLLPANFGAPAEAAAAPVGEPAAEGPMLFAWARERLRVLSAASPAMALSEYRHLEDELSDDALLYGRALAETRAGQPERALQRLERLAERQAAGAATALWVQLATAEAEQRAERMALAEARYERLLRSHPRHPAVALSYAGALAERGTPADGRRAQEVLRPLLDQDGGDPAFQRSYARAAELAGDLVRAGEAHAEAAWLGGRAEDALNQLQRLKDQHTLDYYQRARIDARIAALTPLVLEARRRGIRPGELDRLGAAPPPRAAFR